MTSKEKSLVTGFVRNLYEFDLFPLEIITLLATWFGMFCDKIDESLSDNTIKVETIDGDNGIPYQVITRTDDDWTSWRDVYKTAIGRALIQKGQIQDWRFRVLSDSSPPKVIVGIIDNDNIANRDVIGSFYDDEVHGYGVSFSRKRKLHDRTNKNTYDDNKGSYEFLYASQFTLKKGDYARLTLDMSQQRSQVGLLTFIVESSSNKDMKIKYDGDYNNVAFKVDINKKWRLAVGFYSDEPIISLVPLRLE